MSQAKIYVGNLSYETKQSDLETLFGEYGAIAEAKLIVDRDTNRSKGFAFITFEQQQSAQDSLALDGTAFQGRNIKVNMAKEGGSTGGSPRRNQSPRGGFGRGGNGDRERRSW